MTQTIRTIVVDDMELARNRLVRYLARHPDIQIIAECADGHSAIDAIRALTPDLVFLDVQMPECDGFEVARNIGGEHVPEIVFVTAFDEFAIKAFEVHAIDYLLKPFSDERLEKALATVRWRLQQHETSAAAPAPQLSQFLRALHPLAKRQRAVVVKANGRSVVLHQNEIDWIEASGNYLKIHAGKESHLIRETMAQFEERLDPEMFVRIHRSTIVNVSRVRELHPLFNGDQELVLRDGNRLTMSRTFRQRLMDMLGEL